MGGKGAAKPASSPRTSGRGQVRSGAALGRSEPAPPRPRAGSDPEELAGEQRVWQPDGRSCRVGGPPRPGLTSHEVQSLAPEKRGLLAWSHVHGPRSTGGGQM